MNVTENGGLDGGSVGHGLVGVDALVQLLPVEEVLQQLLDLGDPGAATDQHNVVDRGLVHLGVPHGLLHGIQGSLEQVGAQLLEPCSRDRGVEVDALEQRVDLNVGLSRGGEGALRALTGRSQPTQRALVARHVLLVLALELVDKVVHHPVVKVLAAQMGVPRGGLHLQRYDVQ